MLLSVLLAACAAVANAVASVLQRKATRSAPDEAGGLQLIRNQLHRPAFFGGILGLIAGFLLQAGALSQGELSVVQPVLAGELPLTLFIAGLVFHRRLGRREWLSAALMAGGLAVALIAADPSPGDPTRPSGLAWGVAVGGTAALLGLLAVVGWRSAGPARAALLGTVAGGLFGLTAAFMATVTGQVQHGVGAPFGSWQVYAMVTTGAAAVYLLQPAFQAGLLAAAQPGVTLADPIVAVVLGVVLFGEHLRLGWWSVLELVGVAGIGTGAVLLARSPLLGGAQDSGRADAAPAGNRDQDVSRAA
jgi:drug/metabolite transporter (DMT)-like permease